MKALQDCYTRTGLLHMYRIATHVQDCYTRTGLLHTYRIVIITILTNLPGYVLILKALIPSKSNTVAHSRTALADLRAAHAPDCIHMVV